MTDSKDYPGAAAKAAAPVTNPAPQNVGSVTDTGTSHPAGDAPDFSLAPGEFHTKGADHASASPISLIDEPIDPAMLDEYNSAGFYHNLTPSAGITPSKIEPLARSAFGRYAKEVGVAHDGSPIKFDWYGMKAQQRNGWRAVVVDLLQNIGYIQS